MSGEETILGRGERSTDLEGDQPGRIYLLKGRGESLKASIALARRRQADLQPHLALAQLRSLVQACSAFKDSLGEQKQKLHQKQVALEASHREKTKALAQQKTQIAELIRKVDR